MRRKEFVLGKRVYSCFHETGLDPLLRQYGVDHVVLVGQHTHICMRHTSADAFFRDDHRDVAAYDSQRRRDLGPDEAAAQHREAQLLIREAAQAAVIIERAVIDDLAGLQP